MTDEKIQEAEAKIKKILIGFFHTDAILLNLASQFNFKPDPNQETIGVNILGRNPLITFNPNFILNTQYEYLECVLVHTLFKILLRHCTTRLQEPRQIAALASNITIDELLYGNTLNLIMGDSSLKELVPTAKSFKLPENDCFEEYFRQLFDRQSKVNEQIKDIWDSMSDEEKQEAINNSHNTKSNSNSEQSENKDSEDTNSDSDGFKEFNDANDGIKDYFDPNGTANDGWGQNDIMDQDIKNFVDKHKDSVRSWGKHTGNCVEQILAANEPKISYKEIIRRFKKSVTCSKTETTRMKVNRRYDLLFTGNRTTMTTRLLIGIDESGSMSTEDLSEGFAVINSICKHIDLDFVTFDTEIKQIDKKFKKAKSQFTCSGRGGTAPTCVFEYAKNSKKRYNGIIIFTDGEFYENIEEPPFKVLWLLHSKDSKVAASFGMVAHLDRFENNHTY